MQLFVRGFDTVEPFEVLPTATIAEVKVRNKIASKMVTGQQRQLPSFLTLLFV